MAHQAALAVEETRYHQAMVQAERLAAIGQTIAALSHHIKNILQGLRSGSEILKLGLQDKNDKLMQQGWQHGREEPGQDLRAGHGHAQLLEGARAGRRADQPQRRGQRRRGAAGRAGQGDERPAGDEAWPELPIVPADPEGMHRALLNIVGNALDAVEEADKPQVTVSTRLREDGWVRIVVRRQRHRHRPAEDRRDLQAVRQHQGGEGHRPGPGR